MRSKRWINLVAAAAGAIAVAAGTSGATSADPVDGTVYIHDVAVIINPEENACESLTLEEGDRLWHDAQTAVLEVYREPGCERADLLTRLDHGEEWEGNRAREASVKFVRR
jgi:hypothetical protein